jgi:hypothetical protein
MYAWAREEFSKYISINNSVTSKGELNSQHGTRWICNLELKENRKISKIDELPQGWILGRNKWNVKPKLSKEERRKIYISNGKQMKSHSIETRMHLSEQAILSKRNKGDNNPMSKRVFV